MVNFFRCPIRLFGQDTEKIVVAPADGKIVVIEEVDEHEYFHDRRIMVFYNQFPSKEPDLWSVAEKNYPIKYVFLHGEFLSFLIS